MHAIREDVSHVYQGVEGDISALEGLDAAFQRAIGLKAERLQRRAVASLETWLAQALRAELDSIPPELDEQALAKAVGEWRVPERPLGTYVSVAVALLMGFIELELSGIESLSSAASELAVTSLERRGLVETEDA